MVFYVDVTAAPYNAVGDGTTDDTTAIQSAINTGHHVILPNPSAAYKITAPLITFCDGQIISGENQFKVVLQTATSSTHDMIRVKHNRCTIENILFAPQSVNNLCIRVYGARANIRQNRALAFSNTNGTFMLLTGVDPQTSTENPGSYVHTIEENHIGEFGYSFGIGIDTAGATYGQHSNNYFKNQIICKIGIKSNVGGAHKYIGNLFQDGSSNLGYAIEMAAGVEGEKIIGNYFNNFDKAIYTHETSNSFQVFDEGFNHFDGNNSDIVSAGTTNYLSNGSTPVTSFTPSDASGAGLTFSTAIGTHSKSGKLVNAEILVLYPTTANTNHAGIGNLPFTVKSGTFGQFGHSYDSVGSFVDWQANQNTTTMSAFNLSGGNVSNANLSGKYVQGVLTYYTT